ncbi:MAG: beta-galactosidase [Verrucomicrobia bacterium]|nr:MAG: beta-galactosidase [Verrucomicrobiota bacterium]
MKKSLIPRPEHPRPQFQRRSWINLNGTWQYEADRGDSGLERGLLKRRLAGKIVVPFCPESELSGVATTDHLNAVWYRRQVEIPGSWKDRRILLHFQAVDYDTTVWLNGRKVARHRGGYTPFSADLTDHVTAGKRATIVVRARDDHRSAKPQGKQAATVQNRGCHYTRSTGIWQTVWMESVPLRASLQRPRITPDVGGARFLVEQPILGSERTGLKIRATLRDRKGKVAAATVRADRDFCPTLTLDIPAKRKRFWSPEDPFLYDLVLELTDRGGQVIDRVSSYAGLRSIVIRGKAVLINDKPVFQRLVLDQGYYPTGIYTAPTDRDLRQDILLSKRAGFNGARLHEKVFEERFLYHADRLGYLVWGEFPDWFGPGDGGWPDQPSKYSQPTFVGQWLEVLARDYNHPSIIGWCAFNETHARIGDRITTHDDALRASFLAAKAMDLTRPVLDTSGYSHRLPESDIYDAHDYTQDLSVFARHYSDPGGSFPTISEAPEIESIPYGGQPFFVSEFGGAWWNPDDPDGWGYGERPKDLEAFYERFAGLCRTLLENRNMFGYCYTQLTDVFQEQNGIALFDRKPKFDLKRLRDAQKTKAAIERS